jgi:hypothetical protein
MTLAERVQIDRADQQTAHAWARRVYCGCGCGVWWFQDGGAGSGAGRPRKFLNRDHCALERNRRRTKLRRAERRQC